MRMRGIENKGDVVCVCCSLSHDDSIDDLFCRNLKRNLWIGSPCPCWRFQIPRHQLGIPDRCDKQVSEIPEVC